MAQTENKVTVKQGCLIKIITTKFGVLKMLRTSHFIMPGTGE